MSYTDAFLELSALIGRKANDKVIVEKIELQSQKFFVKFSDSDHLFPFKHTTHGVIKFLEIYEKVEDKILREDSKEFLG